MSSNASFEALVTGQFESAPEWQQAHLTEWQHYDLTHSFPELNPISLVGFLALQIEKDCHEAVAQYYAAKPPSLDELSEAGEQTEALQYLDQANIAYQFFGDLYDQIAKNLANGSDYPGAIERALQAAQKELEGGASACESNEEIDRVNELILMTCSFYIQDEGRHFQAVHSPLNQPQ